MKTPAALGTLIVLFSLGISTAALADIPPPDTSSCQGKAAGAACVNDRGVDGKCTTQTCSKLDYSDGSPPGSVKYSCLQCVAGTATGTDAATTGTDAATSDAADGDAGQESTGGSCSMRHGGSLSSVAGWAFAAAFSLLLATRRRKAK